MKCAALIFDDLTLLDLIGPLEVLKRVPKMEITLIAQTLTPKSTSISSILLTPEKTIASLDQTDILLLPGGNGTRGLTKDQSLLSEIVRLHENTQWTASICTGSLLLAAAGLLSGKVATTHWNATEILESFGATYNTKRVIETGKIITSAGVSSGIDMALVLAAKLAGEEVAKTIQLYIEYDPQPPFDAGSLAKAGEKIAALARKAGAKPEGLRG